MQLLQRFSHHTVCGREGKTVQSRPAVNRVFGCYVFSMEGMSCMVTAVDPLVVLNCSVRFSSTLFSSTRGRRKLLPKAGLELAMLPDTEVIPMVLSGTVLCVFCWRGLDPLLGPRTLDTWVRLAEFNTRPQLAVSHMYRNRTINVADEWMAHCGEFKCTE